MPSSKKMLPNERKKVTASARARISVRKTKKGISLNLDGSYLGKASERNIVSTENTLEQPSTSTPSSNDAVMIMLQEIKESNAALAWCMDRVEQSVTRDATLLNPRSHIHDPLSHSSHLASPTANLNPVDAVDLVVDPTEFPRPRQDRGQAMLASHNHIHQHPVRSDNLHGLQPTHVKPQANSHLHPDRRDAIIPSLQTLRTNPTISDAVTN